MHPLHHPNQKQTTLPPTPLGCFMAGATPSSVIMLPCPQGERQLQDATDMHWRSKVKLVFVMMGRHVQLTVYTGWA